MKLTKLLSLVLAAAMMLALLAGCGGSTAPASQAPASQAPASEAPASEAPASEAPASEEPADPNAVNFPNGFPKKEITLIVPFAAGGAFTSWLAPCSPSSRRCTMWTSLSPAWPAAAPPWASPRP